MAITADNEQLKNYILTGLLLGGGTAMISSILRTKRLNDKLDEFSDDTPGRSKDTLVVPVDKSKLKGMGKSANAQMAYTLAALAGAGALSYSALTALFNRLEKKRLDKIEDESYGNAVKKITGKPGEKTAFFSETATALENAVPARNVLALLAFLGSAAIIKRRLSNIDAQGQKIKTVPNDKILFQDKGESSKKASEAADAARAEAANSAFSNMSRTLQADGGAAARMITTNALASTGKVGPRFAGMLQSIPVVGDVIRQNVMERLGLPGEQNYNAGRDPFSEQNRTSGPATREVGYTPEQMANKRISDLRTQILSNPDIKKRVINSLADQRNLGWVARRYLMHNPDRALREVGIKPMAAGIVLPGRKTASCEFC